MLRTLPALALVVGSLAAPVARAQKVDVFDETVVRDLEITFAELNWDQILRSNYATKTYHKASIKFLGTTYKDVGIRYRGNSSYKAVTWTAKKPFKISMDAFVPGQRLHGLRTVNLNNSFRDPTHVREPLAYWVMRQFHPAPRANYLRVHINGKYFGLYINVEQINKDFLANWFEDVGGNRYRGERTSNSVNRYDTALNWLGSGQQRYTKAYQLKNANPVQPWADLIQVCNVLNNSGDKLAQELDKVLDVDETIRHLVAINLVPAIDSYIGNAPHNFYLYQDPYHGRMSMMPWDMNAAFGGNNWLSVWQKQTLSIWYFATNTQLPLFSKMLAIPKWRASYIAHYKTTLSRFYSWSLLGPKVAAWQKLIEQDLTKDPNKLYSMQEFKDNVTRDLTVRVGQTRYYTIPGLKPFVEARANYLQNLTELKGQFPTLSDVAHAPVRPTRKQPVTVTARVTTVAAAPVVRLFYRVKGRFTETAMYDDGKHGDGAANDGVYGGTIPGFEFGERVEYYVRVWTAATSSGRMAFYPDLAEYEPLTYRVDMPNGGPGVRINEFLARNVTGAKDEHGDRDDWIELYNPTMKSIALGGMTVTDDLTQPKKWVIPGTTVLGPGQFLLIWADNEPKQGPYHATLQIDGDGEELAVFGKDGVTLMDFVAFGEQVDDVSIGRREDGTAHWVSHYSPSPGSTNALTTCGTRRFSTMDPLFHEVGLDATGRPQLKQTVQFKLSNGVANSVFVFVIAGAPGDLPFTQKARLLFSPPFVPFGLVSDASGGAAFSAQIPDTPGLAGKRLWFQAMSLDKLAVFKGSNALEMLFCK